MGNRGHKLSKAHRRAQRAAQRYDIGMLDSLRTMAQWAAQTGPTIDAYLDTPVLGGLVHAKDIRAYSIGAGTYGPSTGDTQARDIVAWYAHPPTPCTCRGDSRARCTAWHVDTTRTACACNTHSHTGPHTPQCTTCTCTHIAGTGRPIHLPT